MPDIGKKLKQLRLAKGLTASELAARAGVARSLISQLESGRRKSTGTEILIRLARELEVSPSAFFASEALKPSSDNPNYLIFKETNNTDYDRLIEKARSAHLPPDLLEELLDLVIRIRLRKD